MVPGPDPGGLTYVDIPKIEESVHLIRGQPGLRVNVDPQPNVIYINKEICLYSGVIR